MKPPFWILLVTLIGSFWYPSKKHMHMIFFFLKRHGSYCKKSYFHPYTHFLILYINFFLKKQLPPRFSRLISHHQDGTTRIYLFSPSETEVLESNWLQGWESPVSGWILWPSVVIPRKKATTFYPQREIAGWPYSGFMNLHDILIIPW